MMLHNLGFNCIIEPHKAKTKVLGAQNIGFLHTALPSMDEHWMFHTALPSMDELWMFHTCVAYIGRTPLIDFAFAPVFHRLCTAFAPTFAYRGVQKTHHLGNKSIKNLF